MLAWSLREQGKTLTLISSNNFREKLGEFRRTVHTLGGMNPNARDEAKREARAKTLERVSKASDAVEEAVQELVKQAWDMGVLHGRKMAGHAYICGACNEGFTGLDEYVKHATAVDAQAECTAAFSARVVPG